MMSFLSNELTALWLFFQFLICNWGFFLFLLIRKTFLDVNLLEAAKTDHFELVLTQTVTSLVSRWIKSALTWLTASSLAAATSLLYLLLCTFSASVKERPRLYDCLVWLVLDFTVLHFKQIKYWTTEKHMKPKGTHIQAIK